jgi:hypothetical protein
MKASGPKVELRQLKSSVAEFEKQFVSKHLSAPATIAPTREEALDVAAYVVLVHGAFENFVEGLGFWLLERSAKSCLDARVTASLMALMLHQPVPTESGSTTYDTFREVMKEAKKSLSAALIENNGISTRHIRSLFRNFGVDVPRDPLLVSQLDLLISMRHEWAHQSRHEARVVKNAIDVKATVSDCLLFAGQLVDRACKARP